MKENSEKNRKSEFDDILGYYNKKLNLIDQENEIHKEQANLLKNYVVPVVL